MTRSPTPAGTSKAQTDRVFLLEVVWQEPGGGAEIFTRLTNGHQNLKVDADGDGTEETYVAAGSFLDWSGQTEGQDRRAQGTGLKLNGLDTTTITQLLNNDFRGRRVRIWRAVVDPSTGEATDAFLIHRGLQLEDWRFAIREPDEPSDPPGAVISTRSVSRMVALQATNDVRANKRSHNAMLARAGLATGDDGCFYTPQLPGRIFWGSEQPDEALSGENAGASAGSSGGGSGGSGRAAQHFLMTGAGGIF